MPLSHSPARCESAVRRDQVIRLLQDGAVTVDPTPSMVEEAGRLQQLGVIIATTSTFVRCSDPHDVDFSQSNHGCRGRIYVPAQLEETLDDFYCPECDRQVFPDVDEKQRHQELLCRTLPGGVAAYVQSLLAAAGLKATSIGEFVVRVDVGRLGVFLCIADFCQEQHFLARDWAASQPTCYVLIDSKAATNRFLQEDWLHRVLLVDLLCGQADLHQAIQEAAGSPQPASLGNVAIPVFSRGPMPTPIASPQVLDAQRLFVVQLASRSVWVEGVQVVAVQAGPRFEIFRILWDQYAADVQAKLVPQDYHTCPLRTLVQTLEMRLGTSYPDETMVRRNVNRLQVDIETAIKRKLGAPIGREDIVQTCTWRGQDADDYGYRLNPACVVIGPCRGDVPD